MPTPKRTGVPFAISLLAALALLLTLATPPPAGARRPGSGWEDQFNGSNLDKRRWNIASWWAPGYIANNHIGYYETDHVSVGGGYVSLLLNQENGLVDDEPDGVISHGAMISSKQKYSYGTYEWRMRMSSTATSPTGEGTPVSGSVSAGFIYVNNSQTEVDFEFSAGLAGTLYCVSWYNTDPSTGPYGFQETYTTVSLLDISDQFHTYKFVWEPGRITYYVDGIQQAVHTTDVPSAPAYFMINHWGTNRPAGWGGGATVGVDRYFYIDWVRYTPLP